MSINILDMEKTKMHLTIIDDNKDLLDVLSSSLSDSFSVESFSEPDKGLDFIMNNHTIWFDILDNSRNQIFSSHLPMDTF